MGVLPAAWVLASVAGGVAEPVSLGPLRAEPAVTVYIVSDGEACGLTVTYSKGSWDREDRLLTRLSDAEEKLVFREYKTAGPGEYPVRNEAGRVEVVLPAVLKKGEEVALRYELRPKDE